MNKLLATLALTLIGSAAFAGLMGPGACRTTERVAANGVDRYVITFKGGEEARVVVDGDGDTDLDLYIYDENGNLVTKDDDNTDYCICTWTPSRTGKFTIKIVNRGSVYNVYEIRVTNDLK